ncbi:MAG: orotate phosphoribosyltransferase [Acidobacteriaceae bacterium]
MSYEVAEALIEIHGVGFRPADPITFKSGMKSPVYCDNRMFPFWPKQWSKVIHGFEKLIVNDNIPFDVIGGIEAAGIPHSAALGFSMGRPSVFVRKESKEYGTKKRVEGGNVAGKRVLLVEDLVTTGMSSLSGVEALRGEGATVSDCLAIISYNFHEAHEKFEVAGVRLHALTTFEEVLKIAEARSIIDTVGAASVRDWLSEPRGWAARRGSS